MLVMLYNECDCEVDSLSCVWDGPLRADIITLIWYHQRNADPRKESERENNYS